MYLRFRHSDVGVRWNGRLQFMCCGVAGGCNIGLTKMLFECMLKRIFLNYFKKIKK